MPETPRDFVVFFLVLIAMSCAIDVGNYLSGWLETYLGVVFSKVVVIVVCLIILCYILSLE